MTLPLNFADPILAVAGRAGRGDRDGRLAGGVSDPAARTSNRLAHHSTHARGLPGALAGGDAPRASVGSAERRLPAGRIGIDARHDPPGPRRLGAFGDSRHARGRHRGGRRLRRQRAGRSPAVGARRAVEPASAPVVGATDVAAAVRLAAAIFPAGTAAADRAALRRERHVRRGRGRDRRRGRPGHPARRRHARRRVGGRGARRRARRATGRAGRRDDRSHRPAACRRSATAATLRLLADGATVATRELDLEPGVTAIPFSVNRRRARLPSSSGRLSSRRSDRFAENNAADAYVLVTGEPQVLVATDDARAPPTSSRPSTKASWR